MLLDRLDLVGMLNVGRQNDTMAIGRLGRLMQQAVQPALNALAGLGQGAILLKLLRRGVDNQNPLVAVHQDDIPAADPLRDIAQGHHGRDLKRARHDGRVRGGAAEIRGKARDDIFAQGRRVRWREVIGHHDVLLSQGAQRGIDIAQQVANDAPCHITHIGHAFAQIVIFERRQHAGIAFGHIAHGHLDIAALTAGLGDNLFNKGAVIEHHQVRIQNTRVTATGPFTQIRLDRLELTACRNEGVFKACNLVIDLFRSEGLLNHRNGLAGQQEDGTDHHAGRHANATRMYACAPVICCINH